MKMLPEKLKGDSPAEQVFLYWRGFQARPKVCKLTLGRRKLLKRALVDYEPLELAALVLYAYESSDPGPKFWRGDNRTGRTYLDLTNLLSDAARLPGRVESAMNWSDSRAAADAQIPGSVDVEEDPTALLAALARRVPGQRVTPATTSTPEESVPAVFKRTRRLRWE